MGGIDSMGTDIDGVKDAKEKGKNPFEDIKEWKDPLEGVKKRTRAKYDKLRREKEEEELRKEKEQGKNPFEKEKREADLKMKNGMRPSRFITHFVEPYQKAVEEAERIGIEKAKAEIAKAKEEKAKKEEEAKKLAVLSRQKFIKNLCKFSCKFLTLMLVFITADNIFTKISGYSMSRQLISSFLLFMKNENGTTR